MDLQQVGYEGVGWIHLAEDREQWQCVVSMVINLQGPESAENFLSGRASIVFSKRTRLHGVR
jgi:hypothetical protein